MYIAQDYSMGQAAKMGPAYFPTILGGILVAIGGIAILRSFFVQGEPIGGFAIKPTIIIIAAVVLFGVLMRGAGLVPSLILMMLLSAWSSVYFRWVTAIPLALGLTLFSWLVFVKFLGLPIPPFGTWFGN